MRLKCRITGNSKNTYSTWKDLTHGTPQGSCLGPLLFLIFCNDLRYNLEYLSCIQFTDDTTLYYADKNLNVIKCCVENDLQILMDWFRANSLTLNVQKTKYLLFRPNNTKKRVLELKISNCNLKPDCETKFLGVILDDKLDWSSHVKNVLTKMKRNLGLLNRGKYLLSKHGLKTVYYVHIYSHMSYCISVWGSMASTELIHKLRTQLNKCIRTLDPIVQLSSAYKKYDILTIDKVIDLELCKIDYKIKTRKLPVNLLTSLKGDATGKTLEKAHNYNMRQKQELNLPRVSSKIYHRSFLFQGIKRYMNLSKELKSCSSYATFVRDLKQDLLSN